MTRHYFRFTLLGGGDRTMVTESRADADHLLGLTAVGAAGMTPWMTPLVEDAYEDLAPDPDVRSRVNLAHVVAIDRWTRT